MTIKKRVLEVLRDVPDDATIEDAIFSLHLLAKIDRGLAQAAAGDVLSPEVVRRRLAPFLAKHSVERKSPG
jgi:predicted transcriptional regulator